jgi:hypothetical protein
MNSEFATVWISPCLRIFIESFLDGVDVARPCLTFAPDEITSSAVTTLNPEGETNTSQRQ